MDAQLISQAAHIITMPPIPIVSYASKTITNSVHLMQFRISIRLTYVKLTVGWKYRLGDDQLTSILIGNCPDFLFSGTNIFRE